MLPILTTAGRVLWRHWPALMAWYLAGILVHYVITQVAGFIGASSATLGFLVLPIAILARLVSLGMRSMLRRAQPSTFALASAYAEGVVAGAPDASSAPCFAPVTATA